MDQLRLIADPIVDDVALAGDGVWRHPPFDCLDANCHARAGVVAQMLGNRNIRFGHQRGEAHHFGHVREGDTAETTANSDFSTVNAVEFVDALHFCCLGSLGCR